MWQCPTCSQDNVATEKFCARCGRPRPAASAAGEGPPLAVGLGGSASSQVVERIPVKKGIDSLLRPICATPAESGTGEGLEVSGHGERHARNTMVEGLAAVGGEAGDGEAGDGEAGQEPALDPPAQDPAAGEPPDATVRILPGAASMALAPEDDVDPTIRIPPVEELSLPQSPAAPTERKRVRSATQVVTSLPGRNTAATPAVEGPAAWSDQTGGRTRAAIQTDPEFLGPTAPRSSGWLAGLAGLCVGMLVAAGLGWLGLYFYGSMDSDDRSAAAAPPSKPAPIEVAAGPFLRGLSNDYRLMFADICPKVADDPKNECKEDIALAGEIPMEEVVVPAFRIDAWEVSNAEYDACVSDGKCKAVAWRDCANWNVRGLVPFLEVPQGLREPDHPVVCVARAEAAAYCKHVGGRLPGHDQYEKAARGVDAYLFPWGTNWSPTAANWGERDMARVIVAGKLDGHELTSPVWAFPDGKSPAGVYNLAGNVAEWVAAGDDALGAVARGGSWRSHPLEVRATVRFRLQADARRTDVGFRCVYDAGK